MKVKLQKGDYEVLAGFRYALRHFFRFSEEAARKLGLETQQYQALLVIKGFNGSHVTIGKLAGQLLIRHHSAVGLVDRLVAQNLLRRKPATEDRRQVHLLLTPRGTRILENLAAVHKEELRRFGPQIKALVENF